MKIWNIDTTIEEIITRGKNTLSEFLEMEFLELGEDYLYASMPVIPKTKQPMGYLHGGATAAFAETLGSICSVLCVQLDETIVGLELNINHIRSEIDGCVYGTATPIHIGKSTHIWSIEVKNQKNQLVSIARLTTMVLKKK